MFNYTIILIIIYLTSNLYASDAISYQYSIMKETLQLTENIDYRRISISSYFSIIQIKNLPVKIIYQTYKMPRKTNKTRKNKRNNKRKTIKSKKVTSNIKQSITKLKTTDACSVNSDGLGFTCYSKPVLLKIKETWNKKHPTNKITSKDPYIIWKSLRSIMEHEHACKRESCWLKHLCIKEGLPSDIYDLTFSPEMPKSWLHNPTEWLSSLDIVKVMKQWEHRYKCFKFIGPSPIDYDTHKMFGECVWDELCKFNLKNLLKKKKKKIGVIFNLDPHYKSGSHWVAVFLNDIKKTIYYFDSYGDPPPRQIKKFIDNTIKQSKELGIEYKYLQNNRRHQFGDSECGMYSMYFITEMLQNKCFEKFQKRKVSDSYMLRLRNRFFNKPI